MTLVADLYAERGIWRTDSAYVFASNDPLSVSFGLDHAGETVRAKSENHVDTIRLDENGVAGISEKLVEDGCLLMSVERYVEGKLCKIWRVDPLTIDRKEEVVTAIPWIADVERRLADLENAIFGQSSPLFE